VVKPPASAPGDRRFDYRKILKAALEDGPEGELRIKLSKNARVQGSRIWGDRARVKDSEMEKI
jgi:hypothetical protein